RHPDRLARGRAIAYGRITPTPSAEPVLGLAKGKTRGRPPLPHLRGVEEGCRALRPVLPLPRRAGERWFAKQIGVGVELHMRLPCGERRIRCSRRAVMLYAPFRPRSL